MIATINDTQRAITSVLKPSGFKREGATWRRQLPAVTQVLSLQKSKWGTQYYVNSGVLIRLLDDIPKPKPHECHLVGRPAMILGEGEPEEFVIDLERSSQNERTLQAIEKIRDSFFQQCISVTGIRRFLRKHKGILITGEAKDSLRLAKTG